MDRYTLETSRSKFYAGGDLISGASNVSNAMGYGKKAARNIDQRLMGAWRWDSIDPQHSPTATHARANRARARAIPWRNCPPPSAWRVSSRP